MRAHIDIYTRPRETDERKTRVVKIFTDAYESKVQIQNQTSTTRKAKKKRFVRKHKKTIDRDHTYLSHHAKKKEQKRR